MHQWQLFNTRDNDTLCERANPFHIVRSLKNASRWSGIQVQAFGPWGLRPGGAGENFNHRNTLSILRIALKVSATLHSVSLRAKFEPNVPQ